MTNPIDIAMIALSNSVCDSKADISDNYVDEIDPQNEQGALVTAYFSHTDGVASNERHEDVPITNAHLDGIRVQIDDSGKYYNRSDAIILLGPNGYKEVCRIEQMQGEAL